MLQRDQYTQDPTFKYHPEFTLLSFVELYSGLNPSIAPHLPQTVNSIKKNSARNVYGSSVLFFTGIAAAVLYKRIPWIRNFTSRTSRVLWSAFFIFVPSGIYSSFWNAYNQNDIDMAFMKNRENFGRYMATRDIRYINPNVRITDD